MDGLSRRTLVRLPPGAERRSETPFFDSTPPAGAAMAGYGRLQKARATISRHQEMLRPRMRPWRGQCVTQRRPWRGPSVTGPCVTPRRPCDAANRQMTTMRGCGSPMLPAVRGCRCFGVVPTVSRRPAAIGGHVGCGQAVANCVSRPTRAKASWFWRISNAEPVDNSSHGQQIL